MSLLRLTKSGRISSELVKYTTPCSKRVKNVALRMLPSAGRNSSRYYRTIWTSLLFPPFVSSIHLEHGYRGTIIEISSELGREDLRLTTHPNHVEWQAETTPRGHVSDLHRTIFDEFGRKSSNLKHKGATQLA